MKDAKVDWCQLAQVLFTRVTLFYKTLSLV